MKFSIVYIDPPYVFADKLSMSNVPRGAAANYQGTMTIQQIKAMKVKAIADPEGCLLALWVPSSLLQEGLDIMKEWGFKHKQTYVWVKTKKEILKDLIKSYLSDIQMVVSNNGLVKKNWKVFFDIHKNQHSLNQELDFGMGHLFRQTHELCLIGINNNKIYQQLNNRSQRSVCLEPNLKHSAKPENLQDSLDIMFPNKKKIEIFARRNRPNWICIGNQCEGTEGEDINVSLDKVINYDM